ncbi:InlB B-repeat-containing protein [Schaalia sp. lx-260]|uniref:InlB B-repeat-containing protein n=1 Tax=Schaalia sp. lx-260 TaxID=2899082 RepID=UPI001E5DA224|nr:hypothetical protein [Schaalia sp. lx-260]MCD4549018.1 hypothetical protein [Schaalia sp. lx-260]
MQRSRGKWKGSIAAAALCGALATSFLIPMAAQASQQEIKDAVFQWGLNAESGSAGYAPNTCNFLGAGVAGDNESSSVWQGELRENGAAFVNTENQDVMWRQNEDNTSILKPNSSGELVPTTWDTKCQTRDGSKTNTSGKTSENIVRIVKGQGTVDPAANSAEIRWYGSFTVVYYSGMTYWSVVNPKLSVVNGEGTLKGRVSGYGTSMEDQSQWKGLRSREVTLATLKNVTVTENGIKVTPEYKGVEITPPNGATQVRSGANWGSWPQDFVDFQGETGQAPYWYSSGGAADARKIPQEIGITYSVATPASYAISVEGGTASLTQATAGTQVTLTAEVPQGKRFAGWQGINGGATIADPSQPTTTFTMPASDVTIKAVYTDEITPSFEVTVDGGTASPSNAKEGTNISLSATIPQGKRFVEWSTETAGVSFANAKDANTSFTMPASAVSITATYEDDPALAAHPITVTGGTASPDTARAGQSVTITAQVPENHHFLRWTTETPDVTPTAWTSPTTTFTMPASAVQITATFAPNAAPTTRPKPSVTVEPHENLDPAAKNILTITGKDFVGDAARNGVYVVVGEERVWKPGEYIHTQGLGEGEFLASSWVTPEQLQAKDGAFTVKLTLGANSMDRSKTYYAGTMAAHALALTERSLDRAEKLTFNTISYDPNAIFAPDTVTGSLSNESDVRAEWTYSGQTPSHGWDVRIVCVEKCSDPLYQSKQKSINDPDARSATFTAVPHGVYTLSVRSAGWYGNDYKETEWVVSDKVYVGVDASTDSKPEPESPSVSPQPSQPAQPETPSVNPQPSQPEDSSATQPENSSTTQPEDSHTQPSSPEAENTPATPAFVQPRLTLARTEVAAGESLEIVVSGFMPGADVTFEAHSDPLTIGTITADAQGIARLTWKVPASFPAGEHTILATGLARGADGKEQMVTLSQKITVGAAEAKHNGEKKTTTSHVNSGQHLAVTGASTLTILLGSGILVLAGGILTKRRLQG